MDHDYNEDARKIKAFLDDMLMNGTYTMADMPAIGGAASLLGYLERHHGVTYEHAHHENMEHKPGSVY